jgi:hypothetical protein
MKITKDQLKQIIGEELEKVLALEAVPAPMPNSELDALAKSMNLDATTDADNVSVDDEISALEGLDIEMPEQPIQV